MKNKYISTAKISVQRASDTPQKDVSLALSTYALDNILEFLQGSSWVKILFNIRSIIAMLKEIIKLLGRG
jgi:hypothetical protein